MTLLNIVKGCDGGSDRPIMLYSGLQLNAYYNRAVNYNAVQLNTVKYSAVK